MVCRDDRVTPLRHTEAIAEALPRARLVVLERCGHVLQFEHHDVVSEGLRALIDRVR